MIAELLLAVSWLPAVLATLIWVPGAARRLACASAPWAALPALLLSIAPLPGDPITVPWLLLGTAVGLDVTGRAFLFFTALLWTLAGVHARFYIAADGRDRYFFFHLLALGGNLGLIVSHDLASFYLFYALMSFSAYGLIVHNATDVAYRAGRVYIVTAVLGETLLLAGFVVAAAHAESLALADIRAAATDAPARNILVALFLAGFGIKAGAVPLHVWLPLAHPVAPTPASAVLSGCMIKAGLLGWLRFLPLGEGALPGWGAFIIAMGLVSAFFGVAIGLTQRDPKTVLAYSSISQLGIINVAVGVGLSDPAGWPFALSAIPLYAMHHGLTKGALFLGVSVADHRPRSALGRRLILAGLVIPALALAGAPLTGGAIAKLALKDAAAMAPGGWANWLDVFLPLTAVGTTALMWRFLTLVARPGREEKPAGLLVPWALAVCASAVALWTLPAYVGLEVARASHLRFPYIWTAFWPVLLGTIVMAVAAFVSRRIGRPLVVEIPAGDLLIPLERLWRRLGGGRAAEVPVAHVMGAPDSVASVAASWYGLFAESTPADRLARWETALLRWEHATALMLVLLMTLLVLEAWAVL